MQMVHVRRCAAMACAARWFAERGVAFADGGIATDSGGMLSGQCRRRRGSGRRSTQAHGSGVFEGCTYASVDIGNPHAVFLDPPASFDLESVGEAMQTHPDFPDGVNVHEVRTGASALIVVPFERGVGLTQACGTGAAASAYAAHLHMERPWRLLRNCRAACSRSSLATPVVMRAPARKGLYGTTLGEAELGRAQAERAAFAFALRTGMLLYRCR